MTEHLPASLKVVVRAFQLWWDEFMLLVRFNALWIVGCVSLIFGPPATFAVFYVANELVDGRTVTVQDFINAARRYFVQSWLLAIPNVLFAVLTFAAWRYYGQLDPMMGGVVSGIIVFIVGAWVMIQFYTIPYLMMQEQKRLPLALRNALFTALASPFYTTTLAIITFIIVYIISGLPLLLLVGIGALIALIMTSAVDERVRTFKVRERQSR